MTISGSENPNERISRSEAVMQETPPMEQVRTVAFVNSFLVQTINFLNEFASDCDHRLGEIHHNVGQLDHSLQLLEFKLDIAPKEMVSVETMEPQEHVEMVEEAVEGIEEAVEVIEEDVEVVDENEEKVVRSELENPAYAKFVRMLKVGVPLPAVKIKMKLEGLDDSLLDSYV